MNRKLYYIYQCIAKRSDGSKIERIFKIPAFWNYELLAVALVTTCDSPGLLENVNIADYYGERILDFYMNKTTVDGVAFLELEETKLTITLNYNDGISTRFECIKIGEDAVEKPITRKTPILVSLSGYSRLSRSEYYALEKNRNFTYVDTYYDCEKMHMSWAENDITRLFTSFLDDFTY